MSCQQLAASLLDITIREAGVELQFNKYRLIKQFVTHFNMHQTFGIHFDLKFNAILCGCGYNIRRLLRALIFWLYKILIVGQLYCSGDLAVIVHKHFNRLFQGLLNTNVINVFCEQFIKEVCPDVHVVMLWDKAGFHTSKKLRIPETVTTVPLPSYSPELNPVENLWHYFRSHFWANRAYSDYDDLRLAAVDGWRKAALDPDVVKSVCRAKYTERRI